MKCPTCGAENDGTNRFCEQCGSRIEPSGQVQQANADLASMPTAAAATCPSCGAAVLPGEAFCDECGASLSNVAPVAAPSVPNDAPTLFAQPVASASDAPASGQNVICPSCGHQNLPGDRFCDNCGAALDGAAGAAPIADAPTIIASAETLQSVPAAIEASNGTAPANAPSALDTPASSAASAPAAAPEDMPTLPDPALEPVEIPIQAAAEQPPAQAPATSPSAQASTSGQADYTAAKQGLQDEIGRQQKIIEQFEQMQSMFGAAAPAAVTVGLAEARQAQAHAEAELAALQPPAPAADPAELARLQDEIGRQQKIIEQFEQMQSMFGTAAPAAVTAGLAEARQAQARAEAELAALAGGAAPAAPTAAPTTPASAPAQATAQAVPATSEVSALPEPPTAPALPPATAVASAPAATPGTPAVPAAPRLVLDNGKELALPADKREIIIGREDPISGIFPEIDLTSYGGENGGVSRQHAKLNNDNGQWTLTDLNSTNYTRVDGAKIEPNIPVTIKSGAKLQFGRVAMTFQA